MTDDSKRKNSSWGQWFSGLNELSDGPAGQVYHEWEQWFGRQFERVAGNERLTAQLLSSLAGSKTARRWVEETVKLAIGAMQLPGRERIEALEQRIATLEAQVAQLTRKEPK